MKKNYFLIRLFTVIIILLYSASGVIKAQSPWVYVENNKFKLGCEDFFPIACNFYVGFNNPVGLMDPVWLTPSGDYFYPTNLSVSNADCRLAILARFQMVKDMGFNTVRVVGIPVKKNGSELNMEKGWDLQGPNKPIYSRQFSLIDSLLSYARQIGLKVILLAGHAGVCTTDIYDISDLYTDYLGALATRYKDDATLFAIDLYNEPARFEECGQIFTKEEINSMVKIWYDAIKFNNPNYPVINSFPVWNSFRYGDPQLPVNPHIESHLMEADPTMNEFYLGQHPMFAQSIVNDEDGNLLFFIVDNNIYNKNGEAFLKKIY